MPIARLINTVPRLIILVALLATVLVGRAAAAEPAPVRVVVVTMFEVGEIVGDEPGEMQLWVERLPARQEFPFPAGTLPLLYNPDKQVLVLNTGEGTALAATAVTALGFDQRFDLRRAYWLVAGISGANPNTSPLASAIWAEWVVDGDLAHEIDSREAPSDWLTGYIPLPASEPYEEPRQYQAGMAYRLNPGLVEWAYEMTRHMKLPDPEALAEWRAHYAGHEAALLPPRVMKGDTLSASTYWHGALLNRWAEDWVDYWTDGAGTFATSAMEDSGTLTGLTAVARTGRVDIDRVLVLRTTSNFTRQYDGITAAESLSGEGTDHSALEPAVEAAFAVGSVVVNELTGNWDRYAETIPGG